MKIYSFAILFFLLSGFTAIAQQSSIMVVKVQGHVDYLKNQSSEKVRLLPGAKIPAAGALNLNKDSKTNLLYNGKLIQLEEPGAYDLKVLVEKNSKSLSMSFAGRFWDFVNDGLSNSDDKESIDQYSERLLAITGGVQGFATADAGIRAIMPADGNVGADSVAFSWHSVQIPAIEYQFKLYSPNQEELVFETITQDTSLVLNFNELGLITDEFYEWSIEAEKAAIKDEGSTLLKSDIKTFEYIQNLDEIIAQNVEGIKDYIEADSLDKQWMEAIVMEQENFIYDAYLRYTDLRSAQPENLLFKKLFAAFLARQGLTEEAVDQIK